MDGVTMEAVKFTSTVTDEDKSWVGESRTYANSYSTPVVVGQVMTYNDPDWSVFWSRGSGKKSPPSASTLYVGKNVAEDPDATRADETIGYIVIEAGRGTIGTNITYQAGLGADSIRGVGDSPSYNYSWTPDLPDTVTAAVASQAAMDGGNGGWAVLYGANPASVNTIRLAIDEDQLKDSERRHTTEQVAYIVFDPPIEVFQPIDTNQDGQVTPLDGLLAINWLNTRASGQATTGTERLLDVNRDGALTPLDALWVINDLNRRPLFGAEGKSAPRVRGSARAPLDSSLDTITARQTMATLRALDRIFGDLDDDDMWSLPDELLDERV